MKVLIHAYNTCCQNPTGGVQTRTRKFHDLLSKELEIVDYFAPFSSIISHYDIFHFFGARIENLGLIKCAKANGVKVVISTILNTGGEKKIDLFRLFINKLPHLTTIQKQMFEVLSLADLLIVETSKEKDLLSKHYRVNPNNILIIPNGVDIIEGKHSDDIKKYVQGKYVLDVGRFDSNKNQLNLIKALKDSDVNVVFIGGPDYSEECEQYYKRCIEEAASSKNIHFMGWQNHKSDLLKSAYSNAEVVVLPSYNETFGMTLLEGGIMGAKLAFSNTLPIGEYDCFNQCHKFNPYSISDIRNKVFAAFNETNDGSLKQKMISVFSWENIINEHIAAYKHIITK